ncbi:hypothetical protein MHYP_G00042500 [Metynnis hypsauchen]
MPAPRRAAGTSAELLFFQTLEGSLYGSSRFVLRGDTVVGWAGWAGWGLTRRADRYTQVVWEYRMQQW